MTDDYATLRAAFHAGATIQAWRLTGSAATSADGEWQTIEGEPLLQCPAHLYRVHPDDAAILATASEQAPVAIAMPGKRRPVEAECSEYAALWFYAEGWNKCAAVSNSISSPAHTSEARDAAFVETLAREYSLLRGWTLDDWNNPSMKNRGEIIADMQMAYDAAMRQEAGNRE